MRGAPVSREHSGCRRLSSGLAVSGIHEVGAGELREETDHHQEARGARRQVGRARHCPEIGGGEIPHASFINHCGESLLHVINEEFKEDSIHISG